MRNDEFQRLSPQEKAIYKFVGQVVGEHFNTLSKERINEIVDVVVQERLAKMSETKFNGIVKSAVYDHMKAATKHYNFAQYFADAALKILKETFKVTNDG